MTERIGMTILLAIALGPSAMGLAADSGPSDSHASAGASIRLSANWRQRQVEFERIKANQRGPGSEPRLSVRDQATLIRILQVEADPAKRGRVPSTEAYSEYFADLIIQVGGLQSLDAADALLMPGVLGTGWMAMGAVADLGEPVVPKILSALHERRANGFSQSTLLMVLDRMLAMYRLTEGSKASIRQAALDCLYEDRPEVVPEAVTVLAHFKDEESLRLLRPLAEGGPEVPSGVRISVRAALGQPYPASKP